MNKSVMRKIPFYKKLLLFINLDIADQLMVLFMLFVPLTICGCILQYFLIKNGHDTDIAHVCICTYFITVFLLSLPKENIEIISLNDKCTRIGKMLFNTLLGIVYFGIVLLCAIILPLRLIQPLITDENMFFCILFAYGAVCFIFSAWLILWKYKNKLFLKLPEVIVKGKHTLNIENADFVLIETRQKSIEFRLYDIKRKRFKVGDILLFNNIDNLDKYQYTEITQLYVAEDFAELLPQIDLKKTGYTNADAILNTLNNIYPPHKKLGRDVVAVEFKPISSEPFI